MSVESAERVDAFIDLRSPYSYLAIGPARALAERTGVTFDWYPFITDFRSAYGGEVEERTPRDVAKGKYLYMDCRRLARRHGLTIRSTVKLWDASLGSQAFLLAKEHGRLWQFLDPMLAAFWRREFDLESSEALGAALASAGLSTSAWRAFQGAQGEHALMAAIERAEHSGVFGAPTFVYRGELFWGGDRLDLLAAAIEATR